MLQHLSRLACSLGHRVAHRNRAALVLGTLLALAFFPAAASALPALTTISVNASVTTAPAGTPITLTATVSSGAGTPNGTVILLADLVQIGTGTLDVNGQVSLTTSTLSVGAHSIVALYVGNTNFLPSTAIAINVNISLAVCTIAVNASLTTVALGAQVNLTATVSGSNGTPTGTLTFRAGATALGNATLDGSGQGSLAVTTSLVGALGITVSYSGDSHYLPCLPGIITITVTPGSSSTALISSANPSIAGAVVTFSATVTTSGGTPTGSVTFKDGASTLGTGALNGSGQASFSTNSLAVGGHAITATYAGDGNFTGSTSPTLVETVNAGGGTSSATALNVSPNPASSGALVTLTATVTGGGGTPTGNVSFRDNGAVIGNASLNGTSAILTTSSLSTGNHSIVASYNGDATFATSSSAPAALVVSGGGGGGSIATSTTLSSSSNPAPSGQPVTFTAAVASASGTPTGSVTFQDSGQSIGTAQLSGGAASLVVSQLSVGTRTITATYAGNATYAQSSSSPLQQAISVPADSQKLRTLQVIATRVTAQTSGDAIASTIEAAVGDGLSGGADQFITPSALGLRMTSSGLDRDPRQPQSDWQVWSDLRQSSLTSAGGPNVGFVGNQINSFAGLTLRVTGDFIVGGFAGYETFNYDVASLSGHLRGDGTTIGGYLGWRFLPGLRFDLGVAQSDIGYSGTAGAATGHFTGSRTFATTGIAGNFKLMPQLELEPSARVYGLWESEAAYRDSLGTQQASHDFTTGRASAGAKLTYRWISPGGIAIAPYVGVYADDYYSKDNAAALVSVNNVMSGLSARLTSGFAVATDGGWRLTAGGEVGGLAGNFTAWTFRTRGSVAF